MKKINKTTICDRYNKLADWYDDHLHLMEKKQPYLDQILAHIKGQDKILELGCGNGEPIGKYFIEQGYDYTGVDGAEILISKCKNRFPNGTWLHHDMRDLALFQKFNAIILWDSLFHLPHDDQRAIFAVIENHMIDGGILLFNTGRNYGEVWSNWGEPAQEFYHASLGEAEYRLLLEQHNFSIVKSDVTIDDMMVWLAQLSKMR